MDQVEVLALLAEQETACQAEVDRLRGEVKKRDLQGRFRIGTKDGQKFRLIVIPAVPKLAAAWYQMPVEQRTEFEAFQEAKGLICG